MYFRVAEDLKAFRANTSAIAAVEFAMIVPLLLLLTVVAFDIGRFVLATERVEQVANSVAEMLAQTQPSATAVNPGDGTVSDNDLHYFNDSAMFTFPDALASANSLGEPWSKLLVVNMASIKFVASPSGCTTACTFTPKVVWSTGWRTCTGTIVAAADSAAASPTTLPTDIYGPNSQIVVDVSYTFTPTFASAYLPSIPIERSAYMPPRNVPLVETASSTMAPNCQGALP
jgi:hypothetical protein